MGKDGYVSIMEVPCFITLRLALILCSRLRAVTMYIQASRCLYINIMESLPAQHSGGSGLTHCRVGMATVGPGLLIVGGSVFVRLLLLADVAKVLPRPTARLHTPAGENIL